MFNFCLVSSLGILYDRGMATHQEWRVQASERASTTSNALVYHAALRFPPPGLPCRAPPFQRVGQVAGVVVGNVVIPYFGQRRRVQNRKENIVGVTAVYVGIGYKVNIVP